MQQNKRPFLKALVVQQHGLRLHVHLVLLVVLAQVRVHQGMKWQKDGLVYVLSRYESEAVCLQHSKGEKRLTDPVLDLLSVVDGDEEPAQVDGGQQIIGDADG